MSRQHPHVLVVDDERSIRLMLETGLTLNGFRVTSARTGREALESATAVRFDAVLSDVFMPDGSGLELVDALRAVDTQLPIVLMTAQGSLETAVEAISRGASDFIGKPFEISAVVALLRRYLEARREARAAAGAEPAGAGFLPAGLAGRSAPMVMVYKLIAQAARTDAPVLVMGESGTGKKLVARAIHDLSERAGRPFVSVNCSGIADTLLEAELFGHAGGAFTGASGEQAGFFEAAAGGTLFLDELASTSPAFQSSLLRVLQSGEVRRVGSTQAHRFDVRVIVANDVPLRDLVAVAAFRSDLFYRLSVLSIELPPLRSRAGDVELLTHYFLQRFRGPDQPPLHLTSEAMAALAAHSFPGNVRELENALRRAVALSSGGLITTDCLPPEIAAAQQADAHAVEPARSLIADRPTLEEIQRRYLQLILEETGWNRRRAAAILGLDRRAIQRLIARYQLQGAIDPQGESELEAEEDAAVKPRYLV